MRLVDDDEQGPDLWQRVEVTCLILSELMVWSLLTGRARAEHRRQQDWLPREQRCARARRVRALVAPALLPTRSAYRAAGIWDRQNSDRAWARVGVQHRALRQYGQRADILLHAPGTHLAL